MTLREYNKWTSTGFLIYKTEILSGWSVIGSIYPNKDKLTVSLYKDISLGELIEISELLKRKYQDNFEVIAKS